MEQSVVLWFGEAVERMKKELFSPSAHLFAHLPLSAYETAWVAMVPHPDDPTRPMFPNFLDWILRSQNALGFWFEDHEHDQQRGHQLINHKHQWSSADLMATLACLIALTTWESPHFSHQLKKGLKFLRENIEEEEWVRLKKRKEISGDEAGLRTCFLMVELAKAKGMKIFRADQQISKNELFDEINKLNGTQHEGEGDGTILERIVMREIAFDNGGLELFRSPSVTACAFITTGDQTYRTYLQHLRANCRHAVPPIYLVDDDVIKLCVVDHLEKLGCAEHFTKEINDVMNLQYKKWIVEESKLLKKGDAAFQIYKDSLAFRLLRMQGYHVSPRRFCWFIDDEEMLSYMKHNYAFFLGPMLNIYKASHIAFSEDLELDKARVFARHILQMGILNMKSQNKMNISTLTTKFEQEIEHELELTWLARMDHLEHRFYIEMGGIYHFWFGKKVSCRILKINDLQQLAFNNFMMRQSLYMRELNELQRWTKDNGLSMMGFGREKTTYCYFAIASAICLPLNTDSRKEAAKCAIFLTIVDDFFDEKGSLHELSILTNALQRWEGEGLTSHSKVIFTVLNNLVHDISLKSMKQHGHDVKKILQNVCMEVFKSWLKEAEWSKSSHCPSIDQYIENAKTSVAVIMILLPKCYLTNSKSSFERKYWDFRNSMITKSLEKLCRLLNDLESYEKEAKAGKPNIVLLYLKENPKAKIDDAIASIRNTLEVRKKEFLKMVLLSTDFTRSDIPREWKLMHLSCLKLFQMFYNSMNAFDSPTALLNNINKAFYEPPMKEMRSQSPYFINKDLKIEKTKALLGEVKISRTNNKRTTLLYDSNKWLDPRTDKKFWKISFACSFISHNIVAHRSALWQ